MKDVLHRFARPLGTVAVIAIISRLPWLKTTGLPNPQSL